MPLFRHSSQFSRESWDQELGYLSRALSPLRTKFCVFLKDIVGDVPQALSGKELIDTKKTLQRSVPTNNFGLFPTSYFLLLPSYATRLTSFPLARFRLGLVMHCRKHRQRSRMPILEMLKASFAFKLLTGKGRSVA